MLDFTALYRETRPQLLALARRMVRDEARAEDVVQQAFVSGMRAAGSFRAESRPSSWMYRITYNAALMSLRSQRRARLASLDELTPDEAERRLLATSDDDALEHAGERGEDAERLAAALATLGDLDRKIVERRLKDERTTEEVAQEVGLSVAATKARLHRARRHLREVMEPHAQGALAAP